MLKTVGEPKVRPKLTSQIIISHTFYRGVPLKELEMWENYYFPRHVAAIKVIIYLEEKYLYPRNIT
jgi:hypothetical protein